MPSTELRQSVLTRARRIVVKVGSQLLSDPRGGLDAAFMRSLASQIAGLVERGCDVTLVSSGAISAGRNMLGLAARPKDIGVLQAVAAVGQSRLMQSWHEVFAEFKLPVAQMLLNRDDFEDRKRYLNIRNCITELHRFHAVPIVNENDTVSVDEIRLGDNDILAAMLASAIRADALVLLTVVSGLQDADGNVVDLIRDTNDARALVESRKSALGTGGMGTKLEAGRVMTEAGEIAVIASGREENVLPRILAGEKLGTVFVPADRKLASRHRWIGYHVRPSGTITVDYGAAAALSQRGKSLLAMGITAVAGEFEKGDVVVVADPAGREIARGLTNYSAVETVTIMGKKSSQFEELLGRQAYDEVIHRDNLVMNAELTAKNPEQ
jgi:glutamate 5-kinase